MSRQEIQGRASKRSLVSRALKIGIYNEEIRAGDAAPDHGIMRMNIVSPGAHVEGEVQNDAKAS
jgi:hypothetical protein